MRKTLTIALIAIYSVNYCLAGSKQNKDVMIDKYILKNIKEKSLDAELPTPSQINKHIDLAKIKVDYIQVLKSVLSTKTLAFASASRQRYKGSAEIRNALLHSNIDELVIKKIIQHNDTLSKHEKVENYNKITNKSELNVFFKQASFPDQIKGDLLCDSFYRSGNRKLFYSIIATDITIPIWSYKIIKRFQNFTEDRDWILEMLLKNAIICKNNSELVFYSGSIDTRYDLAKESYDFCLFYILTILDWKNINIDDVMNNKSNISLLKRLLCYTFLQEALKNDFCNTRPPLNLLESNKSLSKYFKKLSVIK